MNPKIPPQLKAILDESDFMGKVGVYHRAELMKVVMDGYCPDPNEVEKRMLGFLRSSIITAWNEAIQQSLNQIPNPGEESYELKPTDRQIGYDECSKEIAKLYAKS